MLKGNFFEEKQIFIETVLYGIIATAVSTLLFIGFSIVVYFLVSCLYSFWLFWMDYFTGVATLIDHHRYFFKGTF